MSSLIRSLILAGAVCTGARVEAQTPAGAKKLPANGSIVVAGEWQQSVALPLNRDAMQSMDAVASYRMSRWAVDAGYLRVARDLSTVQGGTLSAGPSLRWKMIEFYPQLGAFIGRAYASADSTGYAFVDANGVPGHQARYTYSESMSFGGGASLAIETPIYGPLNARVSGAEWVFSGSPLETNRARGIVGLGLSLRVWQ